MRKTKIAIAGSAGTVGSALTRHLSRRKDVEVVALCRNKISAGIVHSLGSGCTTRVGSLSDERQARELLGDSEVVINCALAGSSGTPKSVYDQNRGIIDALLAGPRVKHLIHFSSISVYGEYIAPPASGDDAATSPQPDNEYGRSKLDVERHASQRAAARGIAHHVLRLGHVFGAGTDRSREIIDLARSAWFRLPFDGRLPSNAIHIDRLAAAIGRLLDAATPSGIHNAADPQLTWRAVFDWHTDALGLPRVAGLDDDASRRMAEPHATRSLLHDGLSWLRRLGLNDLVRSPAYFDLALRVLKRMPDAITTTVADISRRSSAGREIRRFVGAQGRPLSPVYLSHGMPGRFLELPPGDAALAPSGAAAADLRSWTDRYTRPAFSVQARAG